MVTYNPRRIAIVKPSALGDIMHALPVLTALRRRFPDAHIAWVVNRLYEPLLANHPHLDATIPFDRKLFQHGWLKGVRSAGSFWKTLRKQRFDLTIDLQGLLRTGMMSFLSGAERRIGLRTAREGSRWFYTDAIDDRGVDHAVDRYWLVAETLGAANGPKEFHLTLDPAAQRWARETLQACPRPWLAVGVGARWLTKRWPPEHFATLTQRALDRFGGTAIFVGTPDEAELARQSAARLRGTIVNVAGTTTLPQLAALLAAADAMVANDTGPLHLAVALGRPVVSPFTCTRPEWTGPYGQIERGVLTQVACAGSYLKTCARLDCMAELTPERLWPHLQHLLETWNQQRHSA